MLLKPPTGVNKYNYDIVYHDSMQIMTNENNFYHVINIYYPKYL